MQLAIDLASLRDVRGIELAGERGQLLDIRGKFMQSLEVDLPTRGSHGFTLQGSANLAYIFDITPGDTIMLCSDGVHGVLPEPQMLEILNRLDLSEGVVQLVRSAISTGSKDNCTAVAALVPGAGGA